MSEAQTFTFFFSKKYRKTYSTLRTGGEVFKILAEAVRERTFFLNFQVFLHEKNLKLENHQCVPNNQVPIGTFHFIAKL